MGYVGIETQQRRNNTKSVVLLSLFPLILAGATYLFCLFISFCVVADSGYADADFESVIAALGRDYFLKAIPFVMGAVALWFVIAYACNTNMIRSATGARPLERRENPRIYNMVENLCMSQGMAMPKVNVVDDASMNAFASGIDKKSYTVTLTTGIMERLDDAELEAVVAHELSHIRNRDVRLMIVSIIFVGIFAILAEIILQVILSARYSRGNSRDKGGTVIVALVALIIVGICYFFTMLMRFAVSRKREFMADAGSAAMTRNPLALASALRKISGDPGLQNTGRDDVAQLFIFHGVKGGVFNRLFATHPPIEQRIRVLEQF
ncbi:MAG: M48 family metallopeptidase [Rikenellaceae bacterium]|nr:M48 family metallopeptidase [Rikenellaceae bacterium]